MSRTVQRSLLFFGIFVLMFAVSVFANASDGVNNYKITKKTLEALKKESLPSPVLKALHPLVNHLYTSKDSFLATLNGLSVRPESEQINQIVKHALLDNLMIRSDEFSGDLQSGQAVFLGNVRGQIPKDEIHFSAGKVRIISEEGQRYNKLIAEHSVHIQQYQQDLQSDHAFYNRASQQLKLEGNIVIKDEGITLYGTTAYLNRIEEKTEIRGHSTVKQNGRIKLEYDQKKSPVPPGLTKQTQTTVQAQRAVFQKNKNQATFEGNIEMTRPLHQIYLVANKAILNFDDARELVSIYAEQNVCIQQLGRAARADKAYFDEPLQTIRLEGHAEVSSEGRYLNGNVITLFLDVEKGEAKGDSDTPIQMIISLDEQLSQQSSSSRSFTCK
ncbi:MAG: hypothetical protein HQM14_16620 [SAR324 cluster bacterium]|nr:hypothetical protein [SAR324 cluster bacterium]